MESVQIEEEIEAASAQNISTDGKNLKPTLYNERFLQKFTILEPQQEMSKRQKKKLLKRKQFEERKKLMRKGQKDRKKLKRVLALEQGIELVKSGPSRKELKKFKILKKPGDISVAIDLSFDDLMTDKDVSSCAQQLLRIYTANRRAERPIPVHFTSLTEEGKLHEKLEKYDGWKSWDVSVHKESFMNLFEKEKIIYLTSESDNVLSELEKGKIYIIGGLVDHNHHKFKTHEIAQKNNIRTARLPLSEHLVIQTRTVLTINQVFDIIIGIADGHSWKEILIKALPQRKNIKMKEDESNAAKSINEEKPKEDEPIEATETLDEAMPIKEPFDPDES